MKKRILSLLLCLLLCFSLLPMGAFAEELPNEPLTTETLGEENPAEDISAEEPQTEEAPSEELPVEEAPAEELGAVYYTVSVEDCDGGRLVFSGTEYAPGETVTFTVEAEEGYALSLLELDPETEYAENEDGSFSFIMPEADVTVSAVFAMPMLLENLKTEEAPSEELPVEEAPAEELGAVYYTVSVEDCDGGKLVFSATEYAPGETVTFTVEAEEGYILFLLEFDPETEYAENEDGSFSFIMPETDVTVSAVFDMPMLLGNLMGNEPVPYRYYDKASGQFLTGTCDNYISISENLTEWGTGWYVVDRDVSVGQVTIPGDGYGVNLILKDNCTLTVTGGIYVEYIQSLTIYAQSDGDDAGRLTSQGSEWCDAIGGGGTLTGGSITIDGGIITAEGNGNKRSGIAGKMVIINGGTVRATGGNGSPAIKNATINGGSVTAIGGAGGAGFDDTVTINGGTVKAYGGNSGAGIGGNVTINGGTVEAHGGSRSAGIGSSFGKVFDNWSIDIYGGEITASGGTEAAGIGMGAKRNDSRYINIHGGTIIAVGGDNAMGIGFGAGGGTPSVMIYDGNITSLGIGGIGGQVTIKGGVIHANGSTHGAGISGTVVIDDGAVTVNGGISGSTVEINGGTVTATGYQRQAGIFGNKTTINGGTVIATGGDNLPGICHGNYWNDFVEINGGTITATGGTDAAGIGGGIKSGDGDCVTVKINGGTVTATAGTLSAPWQAVIKSRAIGNGCFYSTPSSAPEVTIDVSKNIWLRDNNTGAYITKGDTESWSDVLKADAVSFTAVSSVVDYREYNAAAGGYDTKTCTGATPIGSGSDIALSTGWYAAYKDAVLDSVSVQGDVHLILMDGCTMTVKHGLHVNEGNSLTIYDQPDAGNGKGILNSSIASGDKRNYRAAGIGSNRDNNCGNITIHGGTIIAEGGYDAAGIGGGSYGSGGTVTIYGGNITAIGYSSAAGIGGGRDKGCGNITINGGNIVALAQGNGAGIGTGADGSGGSVTINGGAVTASSTDWGAGIGSGYGGSNVNVSINGGAVTASSTDMGAGIGAGADGWNVDVTITGGTVTATGGVASSIGSGAGICAENLTVCGGIVDAIGGENADGIKAAKATVSPRASSCIRVKTDDEGELSGSPFTQATDITTRLSGYAKVHFDDIISYIYYTLDGSKAVRHDDGECTGFITVTTGTSIFENGKWYVVFESITNNNRINVNGTAHLLLVNGATLNATRGIEVPENSTLNIYAQSAGENMGALNATGIGNAGIGSNAITGTTNIHGGNVTAKGGAHSAGIGGGGGMLRSGGGSVTIYDGKVTAKCGQNNAAGIGGGWTGNGADVKIYGGEVIASNYDSEGNGIGAGWGGDDNGTLFLADGVTFGAGDDADNITVTGDKNNASDAFGHAYFVTPYQHDHTYNQKVAEAKYLESEATCAEAAVYYMSCTCGKASDSETFTSGDPLGHSFPETWEQYNAEQHKHTCTRCGTEAEYADHDFDGNTCKDCGYVKGSAYIIIAGVNSEWTKGSTTGLAFTSDAPFAKFDSVKVDGSTIAATNYTAEEGSTKITLTPAYLETLSVGSHSIVVVSTDGTASTNFTVKAAVPPVPTTYTVTFNMNGHGVPITTQSVECGNKATKPADPKASGYTFGGWYADAACSTKFDFNSAITADTTVYAKWTKNSVVPVNPTTPQTGDNSNMFLWITLLLVSGAALTGTAVYGKKKKYRAE